MKERALKITVANVSSVSPFLRPFHRRRKKKKEEEREIRVRDLFPLFGEMGTLRSLKKAYGALKDSTTVGLAKVNSEFKVKNNLSQ